MEPTKTKWVGVALIEHSWGLSLANFFFFFFFFFFFQLAGLGNVAPFSASRPGPHSDGTGNIGSSGSSSSRPE